MKEKLCLVLFLLFSVFVLQAESEPGLPKLIIGGDYNYPPYEYLDESGQPNGYNVELSRMVAAELGFEPEYRLGKWALVRNWLDTGDIDLLQGMAYSVERSRELYFSIPHTSTWRSIFVQNKSKLKNIEGKEGLSVVLQKDDVAFEYLKKIDFRGKISEVPTQEEALKLLNDGIFDAAITNYTMSKYIIQNEKLKRIRPLSQRINQRDYCFAAHDRELIERINLVLEKLHHNGELRRLQDKWFEKLESTEGRMEGYCGSWWYNVILSLILACLAGAIAIFAQQLARKNAALLKLEDLYQQQMQVDNRFGELFGDGVVMVYILDYQKMKFIRISDNIRKLGFDPAAVMANASAIFKQIHPDDVKRVMANLENLNEGEQQLSHFRLLGANGESIWLINFQLLARMQPANQLFVFGYTIDITDQKKMEEQLMDAKDKAEAANIAKSHFLADMSHEIRTPLSGINGFLQMLMQEPATKEQREVYEYMYAAGKNLIKTVSDILDFSKIEAGKMELVFSDFNIRYLIEDMVRQFEYQNQNKELIIKSSLSKSLPNVLHGDQLRLKQVLLNLMQNAIKFTQSGSIELGAELYTITNSEVRVLFRVADTGMGIGEQRLKDIFENYVQAEPSLMQKYGGTGLGLAIVKRLVEMMKGFIWVESEENKGTSFFFILPFILQKESREEPDFMQLPALKDFCHLNGQVLLVEDDEINQLVSRRLLEIWGLTVDICEDGEEAIKLHQNKLYDLILMDIRLPVLDGVSATIAIRKMEEVLFRHTPIIAFTAAALEGDRERFLALGMDGYIAKPIDIKELHEILAKYLSEK